MIKPCPRCGGQILLNYDEEYCLQCGYSPSPLPLFTFSLVESEEITVTIKTNLSDKPSQIRRRRRRLLKAGYSLIEAERIIGLQVGKN